MQHKDAEPCNQIGVQGVLDTPAEGEGPRVSGFQKTRYGTHCLDDSKRFLRLEVLVNIFGPPIYFLSFLDTSRQGSDQPSTFQRPKTDSLGSHDSRVADEGNSGQHVEIVRPRISQLDDLEQAIPRNERVARRVSISRYLSPQQFSRAGNTE